MAEPKTNVAQVRFLVEEEKSRFFIRLQQQYVPGIPLLRYGSPAVRPAGRRECGRGKPPR